MRSAHGADVTSLAANGAGHDVAYIELLDAGGALHARFDRNEWGSFFSVRSLPSKLARCLPC